MALDRFETRIDRERFVSWPGGGGFQPVTILVNGVELVELVRAIEQPFAAAELVERAKEHYEEIDATVGPDALAGRYRYLSARQTFLPARNFLGEPYAHCFERTTHKSLLLQCTCGTTECWFLLARITVEPERVLWSDFEQFHRDWRYDLGPFTFERAAYEAQLVLPAEQLA